MSSKSRSLFPLQPPLQDVVVRSHPTAVCLMQRFECFVYRFTSILCGGVHLMKLKPLNDRVVVKRIEEEERTAGGIIIPDTAKEKPIQGEVLAVGTGKLMEDGSRRPLDVKAGDRVLFGKYAGTDIKIEGEELLIMREDDILAVIER